jgi:hypothetical protein
VDDQKWEIKGASPADVKDQFKYGYDGNSNRMWRSNEMNDDFDELYHANGSTNGYDGLNRLKEFRRGTLDPNHLQITDPNTTWRQKFSLDALGNWREFFSDDGPGSTWDVDQAREHNKANEIDTDDNHANGGGNCITGSPNWTDPNHDAAGNMILCPRPGNEAVDSNGLLCVYDAWNRLVKVYNDDDGDADLDAGDSQMAEYTYDGLHRRIKCHRAVQNRPCTCSYSSFAVLRASAFCPRSGPRRQRSWVGSATSGESLLPLARSEQPLLPCLCP